MRGGQKKVQRGEEQETLNHGLQKLRTGEEVRGWSLNQIQELRRLKWQGLLTYPRCASPNESNSISRAWYWHAVEHLQLGLGNKFVGSYAFLVAFLHYTNYTILTCSYVELAHRSSVKPHSARCCWADHGWWWGWCSWTRWFTVFIKRFLSESCLDDCFSTSHYTAQSVPLCLTEMLSVCPLSTSIQRSLLYKKQSKQLSHTI